MSYGNLIRWGAPAAMLGGALWALFPLGTVFVSFDGTQPGTPAYMAAAAVYWLMAVVPLLLLLVGLVGFHALHRGTYGRLGNVGFLVSLIALFMMFVGNAVEVASLTFRGSESAVGHFTFLIGFLILLAGSVPFGLAVRRTRHASPSRLGGLVLVAALPLGILLAIAIAPVAPGTDVGFWAAITVPYGVAWMMLGHALRIHQAEPTGQPARVS